MQPLEALQLSCCVPGLGREPLYRCLLRGRPLEHGDNVSGCYPIPFAHTECADDRTRPIGSGDTQHPTGRLQAAAGCDRGLLRPQEGRCVGRSASRVAEIQRLQGEPRAGTAATPHAARPHPRSRIVAIEEPPRDAVYMWGRGAETRICCV